jgi:SAM-dependent methyltransferase
MCNESGLLFVARSLLPTQVAGASIVEFGSRGFGVRYLLQEWHPGEYVGVDIAPGLGVDVVADVSCGATRFSENRFDFVLSTEMLEHVEDWKAAITAMKTICRPGGQVILTTRSPGFPYHGAPFDYWRFEPGDLRQAFSDFELVRLERDPLAPGVFIAARKPEVYTKNDLSTIAPYSIIQGRRTPDVTLVRPPILRALKIRLYRLFAWLAYDTIQAVRRRAR